MKLDLHKIIQRFVRRWLCEGQGGNPAPLRKEAKTPIKLPASYQEAAQKLTNWPATKTTDYLNKKVKTGRGRCHPRVVEFYVKLNKELEARGYPFYAFEFRRSHERQARLKKQGVSKAGPGESPHNWGCAVDIVHATRFWDLSTREWAVIGIIGKEVARRMKLKVTWGGDWDFYDPAHWEVTEWRKLRSAFRSLDHEGFRFPEDDVAYFAALEQRAKVKI